MCGDQPNRPAAGRSLLNRFLPTSDQHERAAIYTDYVKSVLKNPALVGCHWFQYVDEPLTGRAYDGENYNIGFLTVTDTPYPELVAAARAIHRQTYQQRSGRERSVSQACPAPRSGCGTWRFLAATRALC